MHNLTGVILCGGESRRMGSDKGLLTKEGTSWAQYVAEKLTTFHLPAVFSVRSAQLPAYTTAIPQGHFIEDTLHLAGPLQGLLSVHEKFPDKDLLLLACDMLDLDEATIRIMIDTYLAGGYEFYVYQAPTPSIPPPAHTTPSHRHGAFAQPFCGIYTSTALAAAYLSIRGQHSPDLSLQSLLNKGKTKRIGIARIEAFANYNFAPPET